MLPLLSYLRKLRLTRREDGFTVLELLVVLIVVAILAGLAVPLFLNQQRATVDASVKSDVRNTVDSVQAWMQDNRGTAVKNTTEYVNDYKGRVVVSRDGTFMGVQVLANGSYTVCAFNSGGNDYKLAEDAWGFDSATGKFAKVSDYMSDPACKGATDTTGDDVSTTTKAPEWLSSGTLPRGEKDYGYSVLLSASGKPSPTYKVKDGSTLPDGVQLDELTGTLHGTPSATGLYVFTITAKNVKGVADREFTLRVVPVNTVPEWNTGVALKDGKVGSAYTETLDAVGNPTPTYEVEDGSNLPAGLSLNPTSGKITGTPTTAGDAAFTVLSKNSKGSTPRTFFIHVTSASDGGTNPGTGTGTGDDGDGSGDADPDPDGGTGTGPVGGSGTPTTPSDSDQAPEWNAGSLGNGLQGSVYSDSVTASGDPAPAYTLASGSTLPAGLSLDKSSGKITGTPTEYGTFTVKLVAKNSSGSASKSFSLKVLRQHVKPSWTTAPALPAGEQGVDYTATVNADGYPDATYSLQDAATLPVGLKLDSNTGVISGNPTVWGTQSFTLLATNDAGSTSRTFTLPIIKHRVAPAWTTDSQLLDGEQGEAYPNTQLVATGEPSPTYALKSGSSIPAGFSLDKTTGTLSGTPTVYGDFAFTVVASNSKGSAEQTFFMHLIQHRVAPSFSTPANLAAGEQGTAYSATVEASGVPTPTFALISAMPAGLAFDTATGVVSGTPTNYGSSSFTVKATNSKGSDIRTFSMVFGQQRFAPVFTTDASLPAGEQGYAWSNQLQVNSTTYPAATFALASGSSLPAGLSLNATTGVVSGTPTAYGSFSFTITASNSKGSDSRTFTVSFEQFRVAPTFDTAASLGSGEQGVAFSAQIKASGVPSPTLTLASGTVLPDGMTFDATTGIFSGTPNVYGDYSFTVVATNSKNSATRTFTVTFAKHRVAPAFATDVQLPDGEQGTPYSKVLSVNGNVEPTASFALAAGSTLPAGMSLSTSGGISGTPTVYGSFAFTVIASNSKGSDSRTFFVNLAQQRIAPTFNTGASLATGEQGETYPSVTISASGTPAPTLALASGSSLPAGMAFDANTGIVSGTPTVYGSFSFTIIASNSKGSDNRTFTVALAQHRVAPAFTTGATLADGEETYAYSATVAASGVPAPTYALASGSVLPAGLALNGSTGVISGNPTTTGSYSFGILATNSKGTDTRTFSIYVAPHRVAPTWNTAASLPAGEVNASYFTSVTASGVPTPYYAITDGTIPAGLTFNGATGSITGTPTATGTSSFTVSATNVAGTITRTFTLSIAAQRIAPAWTTNPTLASGTQGTAYSASLVATGTPAPTYALASGSSLPAGLTLSNTGVISGTPTTYGSFSFTVIATNSKDSASRTFTVQLAQNLVKPVWNTSAVLPDGTQNAAYAATVSATGYPTDVTYSVASSSALPTGFTLNASTGAISGTSTSYGNNAFTLTATNSAGSTDRAFTLYFKPATIAAGTSTAETGDTTISYWYGYNGTTYSTVPRSNTAGTYRTGGYSYQSLYANYNSTAASALNLNTSSTSIFKSGKTYTVSAWIYITGTTSRTVSMSTSDYVVNGATSLGSVTGTSASGWQQISGTFTIAPGAALPTINFSLPANQIFYLDDFSATTDTTPAIPKATFTTAVAASGTSGYSAQSYTFNAASSVNVSGTTPYTWDFGDGSTQTTSASSVTHAYTAAGTFNVTLKVSDTDGGPTGTTTSTVSANPSAVIYATGETSDPNNAKVYSYSSSSSTTTAALTSVQAHTGTSAYSQGYAANPMWYVPASGALQVGKTYQVSAWVYFTGTASRTLKMYDSAGTQIATVSGVASSGWQQVTGSWTVPFSWSQGSSAVYFAYSTSATEAYYLDDISFVADSAPALPKANYTFSVAASGTSGYSTQGYTFNSSTSINVAGTNPYTWDFGDGTTQDTASTTISHTFTDPGTYSVKLTVKDTDGGPTNSTTKTVSANPPATVYATAEVSDANTAKFNGYSYGYNSCCSAASNTAPTPSSVYAHTGSYSYPSMGTTTGFSYGTPYGYYSAGSGLWYTPVAASGVRGKTYQISAWIYVDSTSSQKIQLLDTVSGSVLGSVTGVTSSGWQQITGSWTVPFNWSPGSSQLQFVNNTSSAQFYLDDFSLLTDSSPALPKAYFTTTVATTGNGSGGYSTQNYTFTATSSINASGTAPYTYDFGDGTVQSYATGAAVTHAYAAAGTYTVKLTVVNTDGGPSDTTTSTVSASPASVIYATAESGDKSNAYVQSWSSTSSYSANSLNSYVSSNAYARTGTYSYYDYQYATYPNSLRGFTYYPTTSVQVGKTYQVSAWVYVADATSRTVNIVDNAGTAVGSLSGTATSGWQKVTGTWFVPFSYTSGTTYGNGGLLFQSTAATNFYVDDISLSTDASPAQPKAAMSYTTSGVNNSIYAFNGSSSVNVSGTTPYTYDFGDGVVQSSASASVSHTYTTAGTYTVKLTVVNTDGGPSNTTMSTISVNPAATIYASAETGDGNATYVTSWSGTTSYNSSTVRSNAYAHTGAYSYYDYQYATYPNVNRGFTYYPTTNVKIGKTYQVSAWVYIDDATSRTINIVDNAGTAVGSLSGTNASGWQKVTGTWFVPFSYVSGTTYSSGGLLFQSTAATNFYVDDISLSTDSSPAQPKAAMFYTTSGVNNSTYTFNGSSSVNVSGTTPYTYDFGDGTVQSYAAASASHTYTTAGTYTVKLTVVDTDGGPSDTTTSTVSASPAATIYASAETGDGNATNTASWSGSTSYNSSTVRSNAYAHTGTYSYYDWQYATYPNVNRGFTYYPTTNVKIGKTYQVSAWVYIDDSTSRTINIVDNAGTAVGSLSGTNASGWQKVTGSWFVPFSYVSGTSYSSGGLLFQTATSTAFTFYVDDISLSTDASPAQPKAAMSYTTTGVNNSTYTFNGSSSVNVSGTTPYTYDFGDGVVQSYAAASASHTYTTAGTYTVKLTVVDTDGGPSNTTMSTISVDPAATVYASAETGDGNATNTASWSAATSYNSSTVRSNAYAHMGTYSYYDWQYATYPNNLRGFTYYPTTNVKIGKTYQVSAWVYIDDATSRTINIVDNAGTAVGSLTGTNASGWQKVTGSWFVPFSYVSGTTYSSGGLLFQSTAATNFYVDDISLSTDASPAQPKASFTTAVSTATQGASTLATQSYTFNGAASVNVSGTTPYTYDFGDGVVQSSANASVTHAYTTAGTYTVKLTVVDTDGGPSDTTMSTVYANPDATINATAESNDPNNSAYVYGYSGSTKYTNANVISNGYARTGSYSYISNYYSAYPNVTRGTDFAFRNLTVGKTYAVSAWVYIPDTTSRSVTLTDYTGAQIGNTVSGTSTSGWQKITGNWTVPFSYSSGTSYLSFAFNPALTASNFYVDDISLTWDGNPALPSASFSYTPSGNATYAFNSSASVNTSGSTPYTWDFGDGTKQSTTASSISHTYTSSGAYTVTLTAQNGNGGPVAVATSTVNAVLPSVTVASTNAEANDSANYAKLRTYQQSSTTYNTPTRVTSPAHSGSYSYSNGNGPEADPSVSYGPYGFRLYPGTGVTANNKYTVTVWVSCNSGSNNSTSTLSSSSGTLSASTTTPYSGSWVQLTGTLTTDSTWDATNSYVKIVNSSGYTTYIDDISVVSQ